MVPAGGIDRRLSPVGDDARIGAGAVVYFALTKALKVEEASEFLSILNRRLGKK